MRKKFLITALILAFSSAFGQIRQNENQVRFSHPTVPWIVQAYGSAAAEQYFLNVKRGNTGSSNVYWSKVYLVMPYMYVQSNVSDSNPTDSIKVKVELWESNFPDTSTFMYVKTLSWSDKTGSKTSVTNIDAEGHWWCDVGDTKFPGLWYFRFKVIPLAGHRVVGDGVNQRFSVLGHSF